MHQPDDNPHFAPSSIVSFPSNKGDCDADHDQSNCRMGRWMKVREPMPDELSQDERHYRAVHLTSCVDVGSIHDYFEPELEKWLEVFVLKV